MNIYLNLKNNWVSERSLFNSKWSIFFSYIIVTRSYISIIWWWFCFMLNHWNDSQQVEMSLHSDTLPDSELTSLCSSSLFLNALWRSSNTNLIIFGLNQQGLKSTIYHTRRVSTLTITPPMWSYDNMNPQNLV
jgi:hypothetical protein